MRAYVAFIKKEGLELVRTYKLLLMILIFFAFGVMSPLMAKLMPDLMSQLVTEGIEISLPEPSAIDSYAQFFKNLTQMGLMVIVLMFSGTLTQELGKGTLVHLVTKGLAKSTVLLAKYTVSGLSWTGCLLLTFVVTYGYTVYLFPGDEMSHLVYSVGALWLFGLFLLALSLFFQTLVKSQATSFMFVALCTGGLFFVNLFPRIQEVSPLKLVTDNVAMLNQAYDLSSLITPVLITLGLTVILLIGSLVIFRKKQL